MNEAAPPAARWSWRHVGYLWLAIIVGVLALVVLPRMFEKRIATIALPSIGASGESALTLPSGAVIHFAAHVRSLSYKGGGWLMLDAQLMKEQEQVATMTCQTFDLSGWGHEAHATQSNSDCVMKIPANGASSLRVRTHLAEPAPVTVEGLEIYVVQ